MSKGIGGLGGSKGLSGRQVRNAGRHAARNVNKTRPKPNAKQSPRNKAERRAERDADQIEKDIVDAPGLETIGGKARSKLKNIARRVSQMGKHKKPNGQARPSTQKDIKQQVDNIAADVVEAEYLEVGDAGGRDAASSFTKNGIYSAMSSGQNGLLNTYVGPQMTKDFRMGMHRDQIVQHMYEQHHAIEEAIGRTVTDLADLGQRVRDGINWAIDQGNDNN